MNGDAEYTRLHDGLLHDLRQKRTRLQKAMIDMRSQIAELDKAEIALQLTSEYSVRVIEKVKSEIDQRPLSKQEIEGKSQRSILNTIANRNNGWLIASSAIKLMVGAGVLQEDGASGQVYTVLRQASEFVQVVPGIYRLVLPQEQTEQPLLVKPRSISKRRAYQKSGLVDKIASLMAEHPNWKPNDLREELQRQAWDFGSKHPSFSTSMAYANYVKRYRKKPTQQPLITAS